MKVLYYHQYFSTPAASKGMCSYAFARRLVEAGHQVQMVCLRDEAISSTGLFGPFSAGQRTGVVNGIEVIEFDLHYSNHGDLIDRLFIFLCYSWQIVLLELRSDVDLVFSTTLPLMASIPGTVARWLRGTPFVCVARDLWRAPPSATCVDRNPFVLQALSGLECFCYHSADALIPFTHYQASLGFMGVNSSALVESKFSRVALEDQCVHVLETTAARYGRRRIGFVRHALYGFLKDLVDRLAALIALLLLLPFLIVVAVMVRSRLGTPVLFRQKRPGRGERPFQLLKFRTMTNQCNSSGILLPDAMRLTPFGRWLRSTSIDELPELINILRGDMSFIGPRPLLMQYLPLYSSQQARRHDVKPGFSGWAQINGRNTISWDDKFRFDIWYVDHQSFLLDLRIFLITIWKVIRREGISAAGESTMSPFQ